MKKIVTLFMIITILFGLSTIFSRCSKQEEPVTQQVKNFVITTKDRFVRAYNAFVE